MKISYNWLKQYVDTDLSPVQIGRILTDTGLEVEGIHKIESVKGGLKGVFVGEVLSCEKHPDADRLNVTTVSLGQEPLQIVCGAPNVAVGQKVMVATVGCMLHPSPDENFKIKKSKIRGVESLGMLCAEDELGMGEGHDGILVLDDKANVGTPAADFFELEDDFEIEIGLTPNRSDAMGHIGVARDLMTYLNVHENANKTLQFPPLDKFKVTSNALPVDVQVTDSTLCPRYMGVSMQGVRVEPSPAWLQKRLRAIGLSPINTVVDVTNFTMHELGIPLHAFDADKLGGKIVVQTARDGDIFTTLDGVERKLAATNLMITNGTANLCIAGVLGGSNSGVSDSTKDIFLEAAYFNPVSIRKTAKMHGLNTDASFRFERGVDPNLTEIALKRAVLLIQEIAGGTVAMDIVDTNSNPVENKRVEFNIDRCNRLIGTTVPKEMMLTIFQNLDIQVLSDKKDDLLLEIPAYRVDVTREADVVEEVLRIYGFNNVPMPSKLNTSIAQFAKPDVEKIQTVISEMLVGLGCVEILNNSLTKSEYSEKFGGETVLPQRNVEMLNPLSQDLNVMRQSMIFNTLETIGHNQNRQNPNLKLYEFGKTYHKFDSGYEESRKLIIALSGNKEKESWNSSKDSFSYYTLKGMAHSVLTRLGLNRMLTEKPLKNSLLQDGVQLFVLKNKVGEIGWVSDAMKKHFGIKNDVFVADLDWDGVIKSLQFSKVKFSELPKTFAVRRDFSLLLDTKVLFSDIEAIARSCDKNILKEVGLFDVYEGKNLEEGKKSYAVSFKFQDTNQTLKDKQVDAVMNKIRASLESKLGAQLR
jgi:phenylalanyl-tRNA synthetase beta chain